MKSKFSQLVSKDDIKNILFTDYIADDEWEEDTLYWQGKKYKASEFSKEFRIKQGTINLELLAFLRIYIMTEYQGEDKQQVMLTIPSSYKFELMVLNFAYQVIDLLL